MCIQNFFQLTIFFAGYKNFHNETVEVTCKIRKIQYVQIKVALHVRYNVGSVCVHMYMYVCVCVHVCVLTVCVYMYVHVHCMCM